MTAKRVEFVIKGEICEEAVFRCTTTHVQECLAREVNFHQKPKNIFLRWDGISGSLRRTVDMNSGINHRRSGVGEEIRIAPGNLDTKQLLKKKILFLEVEKTRKSNQASVNQAIEYTNTRGSGAEFLSSKAGMPSKKGRITRSGIHCDCFLKAFALTVFEAHAGSSNHRTAANIILDDGSGRSLSYCQRQVRDSMRVPSCPSTFHANCLGLKEVPDGYWFCPSCCCGICCVGPLSNGDSFCSCQQCERQFHDRCLRLKESYEPSANSVGEQSDLDIIEDRRLLQSRCDTDHGYSLDSSAEIHSKLNVALDVMHECFEPSSDVYTGREIVQDVIFSKGSKLKRLNFKGFYTVIMEEHDEIVMVATVRVQGETVAEMPLVATRFSHRHCGMCRVLIDELRKNLAKLGVQRLILPAVAGVVDMWITSFGFSRMTGNERSKFLQRFKYLPIDSSSMVRPLTDQGGINMGISIEEMFGLDKVKGRHTEINKTVDRLNEYPIIGYSSDRQCTINVDHYGTPLEVNTIGRAQVAPTYADCNARKLFGGAKEQSLDFFPPEVLDGISTVTPLPVRIVEISWGKSSPVKVSLAGPNLYVFLFSNANLRDWVLENGPWHIQNKPLVLSKWEPCLQKLDFDLIYMPVWVQLYNAPLELYSKRGLCYIVSVVGNPLYMDSITTSKERLEFAKVGVEIEAGDVIPDVIHVVLKDGSIVKIKVLLKNKEVQVWRKEETTSSVDLYDKERLVGKESSGKDLHVCSSCPTDKTSNISGEDTLKSVGDSLHESKKVKFDVEEIQKGVSSGGDVQKDKIVAIEEATSKTLQENSSSGGEGGTIDGLRKTHEASLGVAVLLNEIKTKKKYHVEKAKGRANESSDFDILELHNTSDMEEFQGCLKDLKLQDHPFLGALYTWSNKQESSYLAQKLDRVLINSQWLLDFPNSFVEFKAQGVSNHFPGVVWTQKGAKDHCEGNAMQVLFSKLKRKKPLLKELNKSYFSDISGRVAVNFFTNLIGTADLLVKECSVECLKPLLNYSLPIGAEDILTEEVTDNEIKEALFRQGKDKSPGPDRYTSWFFKVAWETVSKDFLAVVRILVTRLAYFFPGMISASQSTFVKGRNIVDSTLVAQEIVRGYSRKSLSPRCAIKIDLQKAFDSVSWDFLLAVLDAMGLPDGFCGWIRACVATPRYSVSLNRSLVGYFKGARGVSQGDSLSPYLFVIIMNVLYSLLDAAAKNSIFRSLDSVLGVVSTLEKFYELFGLRLNALKTELFAYGLSEGDLEKIQRATGFRVGQLPVSYLGVRLVTWKLTGKDYSTLLGSDTSARGDRVSWSQVCSLKSEGGLGLRNLVVLSRACCLMLVKNILAGEGSLWKEKVSWHRLIWFPTHVPKFSLVSWMAILDGLPTKDRLARFGMVTDNVCGLCGIGVESQNHLFLDYSYAREVWGAVMHSCGLQQELNCWDDALRWMIMNLKGKSLLVHILKLAWTRFVYFIWEERNHRHFRGLICSADTIVNIIKEAVRI
ncbi:Detected protein of confused Function [Hibiscus syriacus]|uniref:Detected protein of confused Function n=1 Tax=Hibiscus syriacus TaxID=106335 RepID=A0A6A2Z2R5_HIBSY|nr:Detected protein of confused Function [Hibiscus syriacus]